MDLSGYGQKNTDILFGLKDDYNATRKGWGISHLYIELSLYYEQVKRFLDIFPSNQVLCLSYSSLFKQSEETLRSIFSFLEVSPVLEKDVQLETLNQTLIPKNKVVDKLRGLKKILPLAISKSLKQKTGFMFNTRREINISNEVKEYILEKVIDDWDLTKKLVGPILLDE
jgi:hypothetical protein